MVRNGDFMKKIILILFMLMVSQLSCFAKDGLTFVYFNGSNDNDTKAKNWFENGAKKLHKELKYSFEKNPVTKTSLLKGGKYHIEKDPVIFYWGDRSRQELSFLDENIAILKGISPWVAYKVRKYMAHCLHDAIWVEKYHNMIPILDNLHEIVMTQSKQGNQVVLYGYSAGSFITYQYLLERLPYIKISDFLNKIDASQEVKDFVLQNPTKPTCIDAIVESDIALVSIGGHVIPTPDKEAFKRKYVNLDAYTDKYCAPEGSVRGVVNFASPLVLFYSEISDPSFELTYYNRLMFKYIIEHDLFWLTVNYRDDPLGFPVTKNLTVEEIEKFANANINPKLGFMYDWSNAGSERTFIGAHTSYWSTQKNLSNAITKAYEYGYRHQYDKEFKGGYMERLRKNAEKLYVKIPTVQEPKK